MKHKASLLILAGAALAFLPTHPAYGGGNLLLEVNASFSHFYVAALGVSGAVLLRSKRYDLFFLSLILVFLHARMLFPREHRAQAQGVSEIKALYANVWIHNRDRSRVRKLIEQSSPDLVALTEISESWLVDLHLEDLYPYSLLYPGRSADGSVIFSKYPLKNSGRFPEGGYFAVVRATVETSPGNSIPLFFVHAPPPQVDTTLVQRDELFRRISEEVSKGDSARSVVFGDFNTAFSSPALARYRDEIGLQDVGLSQPYMSTWHIREFPLIRTKIDHVFTGKKLSVSQIVRGPDIGSDHYPLIFTLQSSPS